MALNLEFTPVTAACFSVKRGTRCAMNFIRRWRHGPEKGQEQLLVRLWTMNSMNADADGQLTRPTSKLAFDATAELKPSFKYLTGSEIEKTVNDLELRMRRQNCGGSKVIAFCWGTETEGRALRAGRVRCLHVRRQVN